MGGLTPDVALLEQIRRESDIPIRCLMRPRFGDFLYAPEEIQLMELQIPRLASAGATGLRHWLPDLGGAGWTGRVWSGWSGPPAAGT